ncbi:hypothetical protein FHS96_000180 [Sphingomonas zeicaulis]|uniref:hypothetical protein n=1 Tax=Sphingomonas zeicaulis TaxID=1632740 RepID=UPI003D1B8C29
MKARHIGYAIGVASVAVGVVDLVFRRRLAQSLGSGESGARMFQAAGVREVTTGVAAIAAPESAAPIWARFAADVADLGTLAVAAAKADEAKRGQAVAAFALVGAVAVIDFLAARAVQRRRQAFML